MERHGRLSFRGIGRPVVFSLFSVFLRLGAPATGFRSLVPLSPRGTDAPPGLTLGHSGIFATPPGLLLSGKRSLSCSCISQVEVKMDGPGLSFYPRNTTGGPDSFGFLVHGDGPPRRSLFCCSDKDEALQSVHEAPSGVSFASIGDTGLFSNALRRVGLDHHRYSCCTKVGVFVLALVCLLGASPKVFLLPFSLSTTSALRLRPVTWSYI